MKTAFFHSFVSGVLAGIASAAYAALYNATLGVDFSQVLSVPAILGSCVFGSVVAGLGYWVLFRKWGDRADIGFNFIFFLLSLMASIGPFLTKLPLHLSAPELFPGVAAPMHFAPLLFWLMTKPIFWAKVDSAGTKPNP